MKRVSIIGHYGGNKVFLDGQTIKTKIISEELENQLGKEEVLKFDTHGGIKNLIKAPFQVLKALKKAKNVIILPAHNGVRVYAPLLTFFRKFFKNRKLHYIVIGGWLASFLKNKKGLARKLKKFDGIYVETKTMKADLENMGFQNIVIFPNCKKLNILSESELIYSNNEPYKLCTFSRVMKEKGIEDAVNVIKAVNDSFGRIVYTLDIYGQVDENQVEWFNNLQKEFPDYIKYCGVVDFDKSVETLKNYFALLFPTKFFTEGIPGTILDAYAAGIPVISSKWESFGDIVDDNITGFGYEFTDIENLKTLLYFIADNPETINKLKQNCIIKAEEFSPEKIINEFIRGGYNGLTVRTCKSIVLCSVTQNYYKSYKLCTFSRVMKEKGIEDAVNAVKVINEKFKRIVYTLDIYGQVDENQVGWFENLQKEFPVYVNYGGLVPFDKSTEVLKDYYALLFPTYYEGEGFAGTIIDAFAAGLPVIATDWKYNSEIIDNGKTGLIYPLKDKKQFIERLVWCIDCKNKLLEMKINCLIEAEKYKTSKVVNEFIKKAKI